MPSSGSPFSSKSRYGWALAGFLLVAGLAALMGLLRDRSVGGRWSAGDQDVDSLSVLPLADPPGSIRAPGGPLHGDTSSSGRASPESLLQQAGSGPAEGEGASGAAEGSASNAGDSSSSGADSAGAKSTDPTGWNGERAKSIPGTQTAMGPKPTLAPMSGMGASGGGGSSASFSAGSAPFGAGQSHPGSSHTVGLSSAPPERDGAARGGGNKSLEALRQVAGSSGNAKRSADTERAWGLGSKNFDGSSTLPTMQTPGASDSGVGIGGSVPGNLKGGGGGANPADASKKDIQPPPPANPKKVDTPQNSMGQMVMMMVMSVVLTGVVGGVMKAVGF